MGCFEFQPAVNGTRFPGLEVHDGNVTSPFMPSSPKTRAGSAGRLPIDSCEIWSLIPVDQDNANVSCMYVTCLNLSIWEVEGQKLKRIPSYMDS